MNRTERCQETAEAILAATLDVVGEQGLRRVTTRAIADRAGVNEVTLFRRFGSKMELIRQALTAKFATFRRDSIEYTGDIEADLIRLTTDYHATLVGFGPVARSLLTEVPFDDDVTEALSPLRVVMAEIVDLLARYQAEGALHDEPPETLLPALLGPIIMPIATGGHTLFPQQQLPPFDPTRHIHDFLYGRLASRAPEPR